MSEKDERRFEEASRTDGREIDPHEREPNAVDSDDQERETSPRPDGEVHAGDGGRGPGSDSTDESAAVEDGGEANRMREAMLRLKAEMDNREKRMEREMAKSRKFAVERLVRDLIPVLDSMDQALMAIGEADADASSEGMELTRKQALKVLAEHGLEALDPLGERFDPTWHEAIATQPSDADPDETVLKVLQKGYRLNERLVRPARVIVAKAS